MLLLLPRDVDVIVTERVLRRRGSAGLRNLRARDRRLDKSAGVGLKYVKGEKGKVGCASRGDFCGMIWLVL